MPIELYLTIMAGFVLAFFLMVGEIAVLRKKLPVLLAHLRLLRQSGRVTRLCIEICGIAAFLLVQPLIVGVLVALALNNLYPDFAAHVVQELPQGWAAIIN